ncbi:HD domain-containing protein [Olivibacter sp. CPCC 100613]|uniref:HD domain-containing protein n=1 Tax=Olivibacter sp. CPCC 100613 TaxID=3079931 RepID=UPI002FF5C38B
MKTELTQIAAFVEELFRVRSLPCLFYHNLDHTKQVVKHAREIATHCALNQEEQFTLLAAAWFHDTGHLFGDISTHEQLGVKLMREYFAERLIDRGILKRIEACIMATKMPAKPLTLLEEILCDADTYHIGTNEFMKLDEQVWCELECRLGICIDKKIEKSIHFLKTHQFFTVYCRQLLSEGKTKNLQHLKSLSQE